MPLEYATTDSGDIKVNQYALKIARYFSHNATILILQFSLSSVFFGEPYALSPICSPHSIIGILTVLAFTSISLLL